MELLRAWANGVSGDQMMVRLRFWLVDQMVSGCPCLRLRRECGTRRHDMRVASTDDVLQLEQSASLACVSSS